ERAGRRQSPRDLVEARIVHRLRVITPGALAEEPFEGRDPMGIDAYVRAPLVAVRIAGRPAAAAGVNPFIVAAPSLVCFVSGVLGLVLADVRLRDGVRA